MDRQGLQQPEQPPAALPAVVEGKLPVAGPGPPLAADADQRGVQGVVIRVAPFPGGQVHGVQRGMVLQVLQQPGHQDVEPVHELEVGDAQRCTGKAHPFCWDPQLLQHMQRFALAWLGVLSRGHAAGAVDAVHRVAGGHRLLDLVKDREFVVLVGEEEQARVAGRGGVRTHRSPDSQSARGLQRAPAHRFAGA